MGTIADAFASVYRDYSVTGIPASGEYDPEKSDIRAIGRKIEASIGAQLGAVTVAKTTAAVLGADLAHGAGTLALVYADSMASNNDIWVKSGGSGSGSWTNTGALLGIMDALGAPYLPDYVEYFGSKDYVASSVTANINAFGPNATPTKDGFLKAFSVRVAGATNYQAFIVTSAGQVIWTQAFAAASSGVDRRELFDVPFPAGAHFYVNIIDGSGLNYEAGGTSRYFAMSSWNGTIGDSVTETAANPISVSVQYELGYSISLAKLAEIDVRLDDLDEASPGRIDTIGVTTPNSNTVADGSNAFGPDGSPTQDGFLTGFSVRVAGATSYEVYIVRADGVVIWDQTFTASGSGVDTRTLADVFFPAGAHIYFRYVSGSGLRFAGGGTSRYFPIAGYSGVGDSVSEVTANPITMAVSYSIRYSVTASNIEDLTKRLDGALEASRDDRIVDAEGEITGLTLDTAALISINGVEQSLTDTRSFTAASGSNKRYDVLYYDVAAGTFGVQAGTARVNDAPEFIPALGGPSRLAVFNVRVTSSAITIVPVWNVLNDEDRSLADSLELERNRSRRYLRKTIQRIRRGQSLKILGFGDSITAIQAETPSTSTPNGQYRDRGTATGTSNTYLRDNLGSDLVATIPTYTAAQLGRTPDANGSIYTKVGFNWELVAALVDLGYVLGTDLTYDNFGQGGYQTSDAATGGSLTSFGTAAVAVGAHVVVIAFGMNELGGSNTEANTVTLINAFKAAGAEVIVMGCPRPRSGSVPGWVITVRAQERAARFAGAAFVPTIDMFDDRTIGVVGMTGGDVCVANAINHPGLLEHRVLGRALTKLVLD